MFHRFTYQFRAVARHELRTILHDGGALLLLLFALPIYGTIYSLAYGAEVLRNVPIGVVDESRTPMSRALIRTFDSGANTVVAYEPTDMAEAERLFFGRKIHGVVYIPSDYGRSVYSGTQARVAVYCDASYFLVYRQVFQELVTAIGSTGAMVEMQRLMARGADLPQAESIVQPVRFTAHTLFNPSLGYGAFVMPAILIVIIQQTLLIGIGMIGGTWRERRLYHLLCPPSRRRISTLPVILGRGVVYAAIYATTCSWIFGAHYRLFGYPTNGDPWAVALFLGLYIAAAIVLGLLLSTLFSRRESSLVMLLWTSVPVLMVSGVSFPREGMPGWLYGLGQLLPSSHGIDGFIRLQSMGASLAEVVPEIRALVLMVIIYGAAAALATRRVIEREN